MTARLHRKIPVLVMWPAMALFGVRFASAQSNSDSSTASVPGSSAQSSPEVSHSSYRLREWERRERKFRHRPGENLQCLPRQSRGTTSMASQWTAGAKAFGGASDQSWGNNNPSFDSDNGSAWQPGTDDFGATAQPGGIWVVTGARATGEESPAQNSSQTMIQAATENSSNGNRTSTTGYPTQGRYQSKEGYSSSPGSSFGAQSSTLAAPRSLANSSAENAFQKMNPSISANSFSAGHSFESSSKRSAASAMRQGDRTGSRGARGLGSVGGSSMGQSILKSVGSFGSSSRSFRGVGRTRRRSPESSGLRWSRGSSRKSFSESSDEQLRNPDSLRDTDHLHAGLGADLGSRNQRLGSRGMQRGVNKPGTGNGRQPLGKSRSNQGLNTHPPR